jgi:peroxiredoxin
MLNVGDRAPKLDLVVSDSEGNQTTLRDLANGGALLLVLLKTSCKSCKIGLPFASTLAKRLGDVPLAIVAVSQDSPNVTRSFKRRYEVDLPFVIDNDPYPLSEAYAIEATPSWFLIDADGVIRQTGLGVFHQPLNDLLAAIADIVPNAESLTFDDIDPELPPFVPACPSKHIQEPLGKW